MRVDAETNQCDQTCRHDTGDTVPPDEIEQREQEDPHDIDEVPVETADLDRARVFLGNGAVQRPHEHPQHDAETDDHVQRVQAGHHEIEREEDLRVPEVFGFETEVRARDVMLHELVVVLDALDPQERRSQDHRHDQESDQLPAVAGLRRVHGQRHRQTAGDEDGGVDGAERDVQFVAGEGKRLRIPGAVNRVRQRRARRRTALR